MRCFGRSGLALGPRTEEALQTYLSPAQRLEARKALGRNVEWDDRVPLPRVRRFLDDLEASLANSESHCETLEDGLRDYLKIHVRTHRSRCAYTTLANAANRAGDARSFLPAEIGTVVNLSWRGETFRWARDQGFALFRTFPRSPGDESAWWTDIFPTGEPGDPGLQDDAIDQVFQALFAFADALQYRPVWVAEWTRLAAAARLPSPAHWLQTVGVEPGRGEQLVILLRYRTADAPPLYRPTQLEAGNYHLHFPSPASLEAGIGGFALNTACKHNEEYLCTREWIHGPFPWIRRHWIEAGRRWGWIRGAQRAEELRKWRERHRNYLGERVGVPEDWMPR